MPCVLDWICWRCWRWFTLGFVRYASLMKWTMFVWFHPRLGQLSQNIDLFFNLINPFRLVITCLTTTFLTTTTFVFPFTLFFVSCGPVTPPEVVFQRFGICGRRITFGINFRRVFYKHNKSVHSRRNPYLWTISTHRWPRRLTLPRRHWVLCPKAPAANTSPSRFPICARGDRWSSAHTLLWCPVSYVYCAQMLLCFRV